ncbi:Jasmonate ZIM domain-containing protein [Melia azedarach]|uniref:Jasmonate ZIM domain-containing protein n=1 Tax=Melia azedarach TaxID=155640 RepID=A0ACC1X704_MELAZ|nr:Jasmonate ZIM domain-containing protein [Melia azedarach]
MERDFLGLNWKASNDTTKENNYRDRGADSSDWQEAPEWPFSKNFYPPCDQLSLISGSHAFDSNPKPPRHFPDHQPSLSPTQTSSVDFFIQDLRCVGNVHSTSGGPSQLTIFYDNSVYVYDDVSPQKAEAVMRMAKNDDELDAMVVSTKEASKPVGIHNHINPLIAVPGARKASLDRFLEKRKDRLKNGRTPFDFLKINSPI